MAPRLKSRTEPLLIVATLLSCLTACISIESTGTRSTSAGAVSSGSSTGSGVSTSATAGAVASSTAGASTGASGTGGSTTGGGTTGTSTGAPPVSTLAGGGPGNYTCADAGFDGVLDIRLGPDGSVYVLGGQVYQVDATGNISVAVPSAVLPGMERIALAPDGGFYLAAYQASGESGDQIYTVQNGVASLLAGNGGSACGVTGSDGGVGFATIGGMVLDSSGNLIVTDIGFNASSSLYACVNILKVAPDGTTTNIAGNGIPGNRDGSDLQAEFGAPTRVVIDKQGNIFVTDTGDESIRKIATDGTTSTLAGNGATGFGDGVGADAEFSIPNGLAIDDSGNLYVADTGNDCIRKVTPQGVVTTVAGNGTPGFINGTLGRGGTTEFAAPIGVAVTPDGSRIYVVDDGNCAIRVIQVGPQ